MVPDNPILPHALSLVLVDLSNNNLTILSNETFARTSKRLVVGQALFLDVSFNQITAISTGAFPDALSLSSLNASHNLITIWHPSAFNYTFALVSLDLSHNR